MASAFNTMSRMNTSFGHGLGAFFGGTTAGFLSSVVLGTLYGKYRDKWWGKWMAAFFASGGKLAALTAFLATRGRVNPVLLASVNEVGQAGVNALGLNVGVVLGLKWDGKQLTVKSDKDKLGPGEVRVAGELPPAAVGRSLEEITVEDLANLS